MGYIRLNYKRLDGSKPDFIDMLRRWTSINPSDFGIKMHGNTRVLTCWPYSRYVKIAVKVGINWRLGKNGDKKWNFMAFLCFPSGYFSRRQEAMAHLPYWKWWKKSSSTIRTFTDHPGHVGRARVPPLISMDFVGDVSLTILDWGYPLVNIQKTMENHHFSWENSL